MRTSVAGVSRRRHHESNNNISSKQWCYRISRTKKQKQECGQSRSEELIRSIWYYRFAKRCASLIIHCQFEENVEYFINIIAMLEYIASPEILQSGSPHIRTTQVARLAFDQNICAQKAMDKMTANVVNKQTALVFIDAANISPSSLIKITKKNSDTRKLATEKRRNSTILYGDYYKTLKKSARCFQQFPERTCAHRTKLCKK